MASLNKCCFIGNIGKDPETRTTSSGTTVVSFSLAVTEKYKDKETTEWINVTAWSKLGEIISEYCGKGQQIYLEGRWTTDKYKDKDGNDRTAVKLTAEKMVMLGSKNKDGGGKPQQGQQGGVYEEPQFNPDDEIPF